MGKKELTETGTCSLCGGAYDHWGNNPEPLKRYEDRCCDRCNLEYVIPARIRGLARGKPNS